MFKSRIAFCKVTSFEGFAGEHSYGRIHLKETDGYSGSIELTYMLTEKQAIYLNKKGGRFVTMEYKKGDVSYRFDSDEEVYFAAEKFLKDNNLLDQYDFLLEGDFGGYPCYTIWSRDEEKKKVLNELYRKYEDSNNNNRNYYKTIIDGKDLIDQWKDKALEYNILEDNEDN